MTDDIIDLLFGPGGPLDPDFAPDWFQWAKLKAPFPWFGGKSRAAALIWSRIGEVVNYVEPFAGSLAVLLGCPHEPRVETVNDIDGMLVNFFRALRADPGAVAAACDWPVTEADLHARHRYLTKLKPMVSARCEADPFYFNAKIAGWWVWGLSCWIGSGWCEKGESKNIPELGGVRPGHQQTGRGVHSKAMRRQLPALSGFGVGRGVHSKAARSSLYETFELLAARLRYVRITCGDFERILSPSVTWKNGPTGVVLDPPYAGYDKMYGTEAVTKRVHAYCVANGARNDLRIALCGYAGDHDELEGLGWTVEAWKTAGGYGNQSEGENENASNERTWFSPACLSGEPIIETKAAKATAQEGWGWGW